MIGKGLGRCISDRANKVVIRGCSRTVLSEDGWEGVGDCEKQMPVHRSANRVVNPQNVLRISCLHCQVQLV